MKNLFITIIAALIFGLGLVSCSNNTNPEKIENDIQLTVLTHDSFSVSESVIKTFEQEQKIKVQFLSLGDTGSAVNKIILSKGAPLGDVFYGLDNTFLSRALDEDVFETYRSPFLDTIPDHFILDTQFRALPVDYGDVCVNYDITYFKESNLTPPNNLDDFLKPEYKGMLVVQNPATSSPGLAFLLTTIAQFGEDGYLEYWQNLVDNDVLVVNDWSTAYNTEFSRYGGTRPLVVSYSSSPPFELIFAEKPVEELTTDVITSDQSCFRQIEFVGIMKGTTKRKAAEKWVDFMLSQSFQEDMPMQMFVFPVNPEAQLEQTFVDFLKIPSQTAVISPKDIAEKREKWIEDWSEIVLR